MKSNSERLSDLQKNFVNADVTNHERQEHRKTWLNTDTIDFWRHKRMYDSIIPIIDAYKEEQWLTVGDGRWGLDCHRLRKFYEIESILASDISDKTLLEGKERGLIENYSVENMEKLSFSDKSFDVVFCKESFHHCPRAWVAFSEMCRVARKAVILIEPPLNYHFKIPALRRKTWRERLRILAGASPKPELPEIIFDPPEYENCGNYVYRLSPQELDQAVRGLSLPGYSWKGLADFYEKGLEYEKAVEDNPLFCNFREKIEQTQKLHDSNPAHYPVALASVCIFLQEPPSSLVRSLEEGGHKIFVGRENPHLHD